MPEPDAFLEDARAAARLILDFTEGKSFNDYAADPLLQSAVERQFTNVGEALTQFAKLDPDRANRIPEISRIIGFRNILVHGYAVVDHDQVWSAVQTKVPPLIDTLDGLLNED